VAILVLVVVAGCTIINRGAEPNQTDWDRLAAVQADPLLAGATVSEPGKPLDTSARVYAMRGYLHWDSAKIDGLDYALASDPQGMWQEAKARINPFLNGGWEFIGMRCNPLGEAEFIATKEFAGVTVALLAGFIIDSSDGGHYAHFQYTATIPFHSEVNDPWGFHRLAAGPVCLDEPSPPSEITTDESATPLPLSLRSGMSPHVPMPADPSS
jgi:hypothetical protein